MDSAYRKQQESVSSSASFLCPRRAGRDGSTRIIFAMAGRVASIRIILNVSSSAPSPCSGRAGHEGSTRVILDMSGSVPCPCSRRADREGNARTALTVSGSAPRRIPMNACHRGGIRIILITNRFCMNTRSMSTKASLQISLS